MHACFPDGTSARTVPGLVAAINLAKLACATKCTVEKVWPRHGTGGVSRPFKETYDALAAENSQLKQLHFPEESCHSFRRLSAGMHDGGGRLLHIMKTRL